MDSKTSAYELTKRWMDIIGHTPKEPITYNDDKGKFFYSLIEEEFKELREALFDEEGNWYTVGTPERNKALVDALGDLVVVINNYLIALHINGDELAKEIHDSNMSKFCDTMNEVLDTFDKYRMQGVECIANILPYNHGWIITRKSDGKVLKGVRFKEPDLNKFIK